MQNYLVDQVGANAHVSDLAYADDIVIMSNNERMKQLTAELQQSARALTLRKQK